MPKLTRAQLDVISQKYEQIMQNEEAYLEFEDYLAETYGDRKVDNENPDDALLLDYLAMTSAMNKQYPPKLVPFIMAGEQKYGIDPRLLTAIPDYINNLSNIESIENGNIEWKDKDLNKNRLNFDTFNFSAFESEPEEEKDPLEDAYNKKFFTDLIEEFEPEGHYNDAINYESAVPNAKISLAKSIDLGLKEINKKDYGKESIDTLREDSQRIFGYYEALKERSEKRTWGDVLKHPFRSISEYFTRKNLKTALEEKFGIGDDKLESMEKIVLTDKAVPEDFGNLNTYMSKKAKKNDVISDDDDSEIDEEEEREYLKRRDGKIKKDLGDSVLFNNEEDFADLGKSAADDYIKEMKERKQKEEENNLRFAGLDNDGDDLNKSDDWTEYDEEEKIDLDELKENVNVSKEGTETSKFHEAKSNQAPSLTESKD